MVERKLNKGEKTVNKIETHTKRKRFPNKMKYHFLFSFFIFLSKKTTFLFGTTGKLLSPRSVVSTLVLHHDISTQGRPNETYCITQ